MQFRLIIEDRNGVIVNELNFDSGSFSIGRVNENDIELPSKSVSRRHARIFTDSGLCFVEDLNSSNGVMVDGTRVYGTAELSAGSQIRVGDFLLFLQIYGGAPQSPHLPPSQGPNDIGAHARLIRIGDSFEGETIAFTQRESSIGRTEESTIVLSDPSISRRHASLTVEQGRYVLSDLGSSNGTRINDERIAQPTLVIGGDLVRIGSVRFVFAAPGQQVDLREYRRFVSDSNRSFVIVITVLALLLVLVGSAVGIYVVLDRRSQPGSETTITTPELSARATARDFKLQGDALVQQALTASHEASGRFWNSAAIKFQIAVDIDPSYQEAIDEQIRAQAEFDAWATIDESEMAYQSADRLESNRNYALALGNYNQARQRLLSISPDSFYAQRATDRIQLLIDPALIRVNRRLGEEALNERRLDEAISYLQEALDIWQALPEDRRSNVAEPIRDGLSQTLQLAGDGAYESEDYQGAVRFYERVEPLGRELPETSREQLEEARERLQ